MAGRKGHEPVLRFAPLLQFACLVGALQGCTSSKTLTHKLLRSDGSKACCGYLGLPLQSLAIHVPDKEWLLSILCPEEPSVPSWPRCARAEHHNPRDAGLGSRSPWCSFMASLRSSRGLFQDGCTGYDKSSSGICGTKHQDYLRLWETPTVRKGSLVWRWSLGLTFGFEG